MTDRERYKDFIELLRALQFEVARHRAILLVEGGRDRTSLVHLGFPSGSIVVLHSGRRLQEVAERLAVIERPVVVLTDWDAKGAQLALRMTEMLRGLGVDVDLETRRRLAHALVGDVVEVEGVYSWAVRCSERFKEPFVTEE